MRSSGVGCKLNVLLNNAVQGCPAVQEGQRPIVLLLHVVVLVDDLRVDVGDYVDGVLLFYITILLWSACMCVPGVEALHACVYALFPLVIDVVL